MIPVSSHIWELLRECWPCTRFTWEPAQTKLIRICNCLKVPQVILICNQGWELLPLNSDSRRVITEPALGSAAFLFITSFPAPPQTYWIRNGLHLFCKLPPWLISSLKFEAVLPFSQFNDHSTSTKRFFSFCPEEDWVLIPVKVQIPWHNL